MVKCPRCGSKLKWISGEYDAFYQEEVYVCDLCDKVFIVKKEVKGSLITHELWTEQRIEEIEGIER